MPFKKDSARDAARIAVQTVTACAGTYLLMNNLNLPHLPWAIISALFTHCERR